ncbi:MAG: hypothetical protein MK102_15335 [Fuerstiella sp.]|nr:hypothetical protein [Fuerstiella sp.]
MRISWNSIAFGVSAGGPLLRRQCVSAAVFVLTIHSTAFTQIPSPSRVDTLDREFLDELNRRQLYDLATDYARDRVRRKSSEESQAFWVDQLAVVYRLRTWEESAANRQSLTEQSIESITEFLQDHTVSPETNLALRFNQIEGLLNLAHINRLLHDVAHLGPKAERHLSRAPGVMPLIDRAAELTDELLRLLEAKRGDLDRQRTILLRERGKRARGKMAVIRFLSSVVAAGDDPSGAKIENELRDYLKALEYTGRLLTTRQVAQKLLAELQIHSGDIDGLDLTLRQNNSSLNESQRVRFRIRGLLRQGKATSALELCDAVSRVSADTGSELSVLRLEALLLLRRMADQLKDLSASERTDEQFAQYSEMAVKWKASVWKDAAMRIVNRYQLIEAVGTEVTELVERVGRLRAAGRLTEALRELQRANRLLPAGAPQQSKAAISLRMGEILIAQQDWKGAIPRLQRAAKLFVACSRSKPASTAELLVAFCMGQEWKRASADQSLRSQYFDSLIQHRQRWPQEKTAQQSTDWLVRLTQQIDPLYAAEILAEKAAEDVPFSERLRRTVQLGEQLEQARHVVSESRSRKSWSELVDALQILIDTHELMTGELTDQSARLLLLSVSLNTGHETETELWEQISSQLVEAALVIENIDPVTQNRLSLIRLLSTARTSAESNVLQRQKLRYLSETSGDQLLAAIQLARHLSAGIRTQPGDKLIAATIDQLIIARISTTSSAEELSKILKVATLSYRVTNDDSVKIQALNRLISLDPNTEQTMEIAAALEKSTGRRTPHQLTEQSTFWKRVRRESKEGSELWLESCVQLARIQAQLGDPDEAARQLRVTSVIYPEWGSEQRRQRVAEFLDAL